MNDMTWAEAVAAEQANRVMGEALADYLTLRLPGSKDIIRFCADGATIYHEENPTATSTHVTMNKWTVAEIEAFVGRLVALFPQKAAPGAAGEGV